MDWLESTRQVALGLPETSEHFQWKAMVFKVVGKVFVVVDPKDNTMMFKPRAENHARYVTDPAMSLAPYLGHKGWLLADLSALQDAEVAEELVRESYAVIVGQLPKSRRPNIR